MSAQTTEICQTFLEVLKQNGQSGYTRSIIPHNGHWLLPFKCIPLQASLFTSRVLLLLVEVSPHVTICHLLAESSESVPLHLAQPFTITGTSSSHFAMPAQHDSSFCKCFNSTEVYVKMLSWFLNPCCAALCACAVWCLIHRACLEGNVWP